MKSNVFIGDPVYLIKQINAFCAILCKHFLLHSVPAICQVIQALIDHIESIILILQKKFVSTCYFPAKSNYVSYYQIIRAELFQWYQKIKTTVEYFLPPLVDIFIIAASSDDSLISNFSSFRNIKSVFVDFIFQLGMIEHLYSSDYSPVNSFQLDYFTEIIYQQRTHNTDSSSNRNLIRISNDIKPELLDSNIFIYQLMEIIFLFLSFPTRFGLRLMALFTAAKFIVSSFQEQQEYLDYLYLNSSRPPTMRIYPTDQSFSMQCDDEKNHYGTNNEYRLFKSNPQYCCISNFISRDSILLLC
jgi:hypothetical protein